MKPTKPQNSRSGFMKDGVNPDAAINGSITPVEFIFGPPSDEAWIMEQLLIQILTNSTGIDDVDFGDIAALSTGIGAKIIDSSGTILDYTALSNIKSNNDLAALGFETVRSQYDTKPKGLTGLFIFSNSRSSNGILLDGAKGEKFVITVNDDLTTLVQVLSYISATLSVN